MPGCGSSALPSGFAPAGEVVLVTDLCEGQRAVVLQLPAGAKPEGKAEEPQPGITQESILT